MFVIQIFTVPGFHSFWFDRLLACGHVNEVDLTLLRFLHLVAARQWAVLEVVVVADPATAVAWLRCVDVW